MDNNDRDTYIKFVNIIHNYDSTSRVKHDNISYDFCSLDELDGYNYPDYLPYEPPTTSNDISNAVVIVHVDFIINDSQDFLAIFEQFIRGNPNITELGFSTDRSKPDNNGDDSEQF